MRWVVSLAACTLCLLACRDAAPGAGSGPPAAENDEPSCGELSAAAAMRRLSRFEYDNSVRDLLGSSLPQAEKFPPDVEIDEFDNAIGGLAVSRLHAEAYLLAAEELASEASSRLDLLLPCDIDDPQCGQTFVEHFARRAYRRPPTTDEVQRLLSLYASQRDAAASVAIVVEVVLQSPQFLYRLEFGDNGGSPITQFELATRLSYLLWASMPDDELLDAAEAGTLAEPNALRAQVERMLADPRAAQSVAHFHRQWLGLDDAHDKPKEAPEWSADVALVLEEEADAFVDAVFWEGGTLTSLLTAPYAMTDNRSRALVPEERAGILTQPALLAALAKPEQTHPVARGKFVRERLLCQSPPPPPADVDVMVPEPAPGVSTRERFAAHTSDPQCSACHRLLDPIGFALEHYDMLGRYRSEDAGRPIDASGDLVDTDVDGPLVGAAGLAEKLAASDQVSRCLVTRWFTYAHGRAPTEADACTIDALERRFADADHVMVDLVLALTETDAFRTSP